MTQRLDDEARPDRVQTVACGRDMPPLARTRVGGARCGGALVERERPPLARRRAARAVLASVVRALGLITHRRIHGPRMHVGRTVAFANGSSASVYRETLVARGTTRCPAVLIVEFRLRWVRGRAHAWFRAESILHTPLFIGFPGFVRKLWLADDQHSVYRGLYEWDGPALAHAYARALSRVLALVSVPDSIHYVVLPGVRLDEVLLDPGVVPADGPQEWSRPTSVTPASGS